MNDLENISMYPYGYGDKLSRNDTPQPADEEALRSELFEKTAHPNDDLARGLGWTALAAMTGGLAAGRFENEVHLRPVTEKQVRALGGISLSYLTRIEQTNTAVNEAAILGYGNAQAA
jgi:hypothetical protein